MTQIVATPPPHLPSLTWHTSILLAHPLFVNVNAAESVSANSDTYGIDMVENNSFNKLSMGYTTEDVADSSCVSH